MLPCCSSQAFASSAPRRRTSGSTITSGSLRDDVRAVIGGASHILLDVDGVICLGDDPLLDAGAVVRTLSQLATVVVTTNDSRRGPREQRDRLAAAGVPDTVVLVQAVDAVAARLRAAGVDRVAAVGTPGLVENLERHGVEVVDRAASPQAVVVGCAPVIDHIDPASLVDGLADLPWLATNRDEVVPAPGGRSIPDTGAVLALLAPLVRGDIEVCGKPSPWMLAATQVVAGPVDRAVVIGDGVATDVAWAQANGWHCIHVDKSTETPRVPGASLRVASLGALLA